MPDEVPFGRLRLLGVAVPGAGRRRLVRHPQRERRLLAERCEVEAAVDPAGELVEHDLGIRREGDVEARGELRDPRELVGDGRDHRTAQALHPALEVHRGPLALERSRRREDQVGPACGERGEQRDDDHVVGPLGERAHARVGRRLVARHDEEPDALGLDLVLVRRGGPRLGDAARVGRGGEVECRATGLPFEAERVRDLCEPRAAAAARARPDQDGAVGGTESFAEGVSPVGQAPQLVGGLARRGRHGATRADGDDLGAVPAGTP